MLTHNAPCFVSTSASKDRRDLIPARVERVAPNGATIRTDASIEARDGADITVYCEVRGKLHQQPAKLVRATGNTLELRVSGEPTLCDARAYDRVNVSAMNITLSVDAQPNCALLDISPEGASVFTAKPLMVGSVVNIDLCLEGIYARGTLRVQTERKLPDGRFRHGLVAADKKSAIRKSLLALSNLLQRRQLQRVARAA